MIVKKLLIKLSFIVKDKKVWFVFIVGFFLILSYVFYNFWYIVFFFFGIFIYCINL